MSGADSARMPVAITGWGAERQLVATRDAVAGALLLAELPIAFAEVSADDDAQGLGPWRLLESILASEPVHARVSAEALKLTKWPLSATDGQRLGELAQRHRRNADKLAQLYHRVAANNIRYAVDGVIGYGIWPMVSRCNHSCAPNVRLAALHSEPLAELLLATRPIGAGEALCWNYFADDSFLGRDWVGRNAWLLRDFQFLCRCPRCLAEQPPALAALSRPALLEHLRRVAG